MKHCLVGYLHIIGKMCDFAIDLPHEKINKLLQMQNIEKRGEIIIFSLRWSHIASFGSWRPTISLKKFFLFYSHRSQDDSWVIQPSPAGLEGGSVPDHPQWAGDTGWLILGLDEEKTKLVSYQSLVFAETMRTNTETRIGFIRIRRNRLFIKMENRWNEHFLNANDKLHNWLDKTKPKTCIDQQPSDKSNYNQNFSFTFSPTPKMHQALFIGNFQRMAKL